MAIGLTPFPFEQRLQQEVGYGPGVGAKKEVWQVVPNAEELKAKYAREYKWPRDEDFRESPEPQPRDGFKADHRGANELLTRSVTLCCQVPTFFLPPIYTAGCRALHASNIQRDPPGQL
jgi:hypothetical protein